MDGDGYLPVRATVHLQGLQVGETALVDPKRPYIAELLDASFLVPVESSADGVDLLAVAAATPRVHDVDG